MIQCLLALNYAAQTCSDVFGISHLNNSEIRSLNDKDAVLLLQAAGWYLTKLTRTKGAFPVGPFFEAEIKI